MRNRDLLEIRAAVGGLPQVHVERPQHVGILRVGEDVVVVPRPLGQIRVVGEMRPGLAAIVRAVDALVGARGVDDRPHTVGSRRRQSDADAALVALRQAGLAAQIRPGVAAVGGLVDSGARARRCGSPRGSGAARGWWRRGFSGCPDRARCRSRRRSRSGRAPSARCRRRRGCGRRRGRDSAPTHRRAPRRTRCRDSSGPPAGVRSAWSLRAQGASTSCRRRSTYRCRRRDDALPRKHASPMPT